MIDRPIRKQMNSLIRLQDCFRVGDIIDRRLA